MDINPLSTCYQALDEANNQLGLLSEPCRTVVVVDTAAGIIGNGGLAYFFELNFPGDPDYGLFVDAFRRAGLGEIADRLAGLVASFPFDAPHTSSKRRTAFLEDRPAEFESQMRQLENLVWSADIDAALARYVDAEP